MKPRRVPVLAWVACGLGLVVLFGLLSIGVGLMMSSQHPSKGPYYGIGLNNSGMPVVVTCPASGGVEAVSFAAGTVSSGDWQSEATERVSLKRLSGETALTLLPVSKTKGYTLSGGSLDLEGVYVIDELRTVRGGAIQSVFEVDFSKLEAEQVISSDGQLGPLETWRSSNHC